MKDETSGTLVFQSSPVTTTNVRHVNYVRSCQNYLTKLQTKLLMNVLCMEMQHQTLIISLISFFLEPRGVLPEKLGVGVRPTSQNPYPIYDQNLRFSLPYL